MCLFSRILQLSGVLWRANFLKIQNIIRVPDFISRMFKCTLGRLLGGSSLIEQKNTSIGATLGKFVTRTNYGACVLLHDKTWIGFFYFLFNEIQ